MKKRPLGFAALFGILLLFTLISSCYSQEGTKSNALNGKTSIEENSTLQSPWKDPLFFIEGQLCQHVRKIFEDSRGDLWFGTNVYGIMHFDGDTLLYLEEEKGLDLGRITAILEDKDGNVWLAGYQGLAKYDGASFHLYTEERGLLNNELWSTIIDRKGQFWIGTNAGVSRFDGKEFVTFPIPKTKVEDTTTVYSPDRITAILEDKNGTLWFGTDGFGIAKYDGQGFTHFTMKDGLCDNTISELMEDSQGNIWIGTYFGGVSMYDGETFSNFTTDGVIEGVEVGGLYEDREGNIWFAVENKGVYRYDPAGKSFVNFGKEDGLETNGILSIFKDNQERFWFGGWGGLFRYDGTAFSPVTKDGPWVP